MAKEPRVNKVLARKRVDTTEEVIETMATITNQDIRLSHIKFDYSTLAIDDVEKNKLIEIYKLLIILLYAKNIILANNTPTNKYPANTTKLPEVPSTNFLKLNDFQAQLNGSLYASCNLYRMNTNKKI